MLMQPCPSPIALCSTAGKQAGNESKAGKQGGRQCKQRLPVAMANLTYVQLARACSQLVSQHRHEIVLLVSRCLHVPPPQAHPDSFALSAFWPCREFLRYMHHKHVGHTSALRSSVLPCCLVALETKCPHHVLLQTCCRIYCC